MICYYKEPDFNCFKCPRLKTFINYNRIKYPAYFNGPVPRFGDINSELLIVGLAPGLHGANQSGIPFNGDYAGNFLYPNLIKYGWAMGNYIIGNKNIKLINACITNVVRCVPPGNKPLGVEINTCREFLIDEVKNPNIKIILTLGITAHNSTIKALGKKISEYKFEHGKVYKISGKTLISSYHCSKNNTVTGKMTREQFEDIFKIIEKNRIK